MDPPPLKKRKVSLYDLFEYQKYCDVTFSCNDPTSATGKSTIMAHKFVLSQTSDVFDTMFNGEAAKRVKGRRETLIVIDDIQMPTFKLLLSFMYNKLVDFKTANIASEFYYAAHKYNCIDAVEFIEAYMLKEVSSENAIVFYETACLYENQPLKDACVEICSEDTMDILNSPNFYKASPNVIEAIYGLNELYITSELQLVHALERYVSHNQGEDPEILEKVRPALSQIRFLTLSAPQIAETTLLNAEDSTAVVGCLSSGGEVSKMPAFLSSNNQKRSLKWEASEIEMMRKLSGVFSDKYCPSCCKSNRRSDHALWNCDNCIGINDGKLKIIYQKYNHVCLLDYADDLEEVYEIYSSIGQLN